MIASRICDLLLDWIFSHSLLSSFGGWEWLFFQHKSKVKIFTLKSRDESQSRRGFVPLLILSFVNSGFFHLADQIDGAVSMHYWFVVSQYLLWTVSKSLICALYRSSRILRYYRYASPKLGIHTRNEPWDAISLRCGFPLGILMAMHLEMHYFLSMPPLHAWCVSVIISNLRIRTF
jgi:hypothetical protein